MKPGRGQQVLGSFKQGAQDSHTGQLFQVKIERKDGSGPGGSPGEGLGVPGGGKGQCKGPEARACLAGVRSSNLASVAGAEKWGVSSRCPQRGGEEAGRVGLDAE